MLLLVQEKEEDQCMGDRSIHFQYMITYVNKVNIQCKEVGYEKIIRYFIFNYKALFVQV